MDIGKRTRVPTRCVKHAVLLFSKVSKLFLGYFDPEKIFLDNESKYFSG